MSELPSGEEVALLRRRLEREQRARVEAEAIAESATRALFDRQRELELIVAVGAAADETGDVSMRLRRILAALCEIGGWSIGQIYLVEPDSGVLRVTGIWSSPEPVRFGEFRAATEEAAFEVGRGLPGMVLRSGEPLAISDLIEDNRFFRQEAARACALRGAFAFPAHFGDQVVGVVELLSTATIAAEDVLETATVVGGYVGRLVARERGAA